MNTDLDLATTINNVSRLEGTFILRSGATATEYFDKYQFESDPVILREIAKSLAPLVPKETEMLAGLELGGALEERDTSTTSSAESVYEIERSRRVQR